MYILSSGFDAFGEVMKPQTDPTLNATPKTQEKLAGKDLDTNLVELAGSLAINGSNKVKCVSVSVRDFIHSVVAMVARWIRCWPKGLAVPDSSFSVGGNLSNIKHGLVHTAFHNHLAIVCY